MIKVLFCGAFPRNKDFSGSFTSNIMIVKHLLASGKFEVKTVAPIFKNETVPDLGFPITFVPTKYLRGKSFGDIGCKLSFARQVEKFIKNTRFMPDVIFVDANPYLCKIAPKIPKILSLHGSAKYKKGIVYALKHPYTGLSDILEGHHELKALKNKMVKKVITNSRYSKEVMISDYALPSALAREINAVPRGCDVARFEVDKMTKEECRAKINEKLGIAKHKLDCLLSFAGGISDHKGQRDLIRDMATLITARPNVGLILIGKDSGDMTHCKNIVKENGLENNVFFSGSVSDHELGIFLKGSDIYTSASVEGYGINQVEAMTLSLPLVAWDKGAVKELFEHGTSGFLVKNSNEYITYLTRLIDDKNLRAHMGENAREHALEFHNSKILGEAVEKICENIAHNKK